VRRRRDAVVTIVFETHSTSTDNERWIASGWLDGQLSALGRRQAKELGERRAADRLAAVFTSDLGRATETARIAFGGRRVPVFHDWRLRR
jgi:alpha-ribazole phosphatase/probable phosphoglycerate mutase